MMTLTDQALLFAVDPDDHERDQQPRKRRIRITTMEMGSVQ